MKRAYVRWIWGKGGVLLEVESKVVGSPEHFYQKEMNVKSDLFTRAKVRGIVKEESEDGLPSSERQGS